MTSPELPQQETIETHDIEGMEPLSPFAQELLREVSHLIRSPLGSIMMMADMLRTEETGRLTEEQARHVAIIYRAAMSLTRMASDILTLVDDRDRIERRESFSITELMGAVRDGLGPVAESKRRRIAVRVEVDPHREGPALALLEVLFGLGIRAILDGDGGGLELAAEDGGGDLVRFVVALLPPAGVSELEGGTGERGLAAILRVEDATGKSTLSADGLAEGAAGRIVRDLGSELEVESGEGHLRRLVFQLELPPR